MIFNILDAEVRRWQLHIKSVDLLNENRQLEAIFLKVFYGQLTAV